MASRFSRFSFAFAAVLAGVASLHALSCGPAEDQKCGTPAETPTFRLTVSASDGPVPNDVKVLVRYGSGEEEFIAENPDETPHVVFCALHMTNAADASDDTSDGDAKGDGPGEEDAPATEAGPEAASTSDDASDGASGSANDGSKPGQSGHRDGKPAIEKLVCDLWTHGAATVRVRAGGYPDVERELAAERDACGIVMKEEHITLERGE